MAKDCIDILKDASPQLHKYLEGKAGVYDRSAGSKQAYRNAASELQNETLDNLHNVYSKLGLKGFEKPVEAQPQQTEVVPKERIDYGREGWANTGIKFNNNKQGEPVFKAKDGEEYTIRRSGKDKDIYVAAYDKNEKNVSSAYFTKDSDGNYSAHEVASDIPSIGLARALYDYVDSNIGQVVKSSSLSGEGMDFWNANNDFKYSQPNEQNKPTQQPEVVSNEALKDVEGTTKALEEVNKKNRETFNEITKISSYYHGSPMNALSAEDYISNRHGLIFFTKNEKFAERFLKKRSDLQIPKGVVGGEPAVSKQIVLPKKTLNYRNIPKEVIDILEDNADLSYLHPKRVGFGFNATNDYTEAIQEAAEAGDWHLFENKKVIDKLKELGYDSIILSDDAGYNEGGLKIYEDVLAVFYKSLIKDVNPNTIAESYHKAKSDASNPELVKAVEDAINSKANEQNKPTPLPLQTEATKGEPEKVGEAGGQTEKGTAFSKKARSLAAAIRTGGLRAALPDWAKADLPEGTQQAGFGGKSLDEAVATAIELVADAVDAGKEFADAIKQGFAHLKDYYTKNTKSFDEKKVSREFTANMNALFEGEPPKTQPPAAKAEPGEIKMRSVYKNVINRSKLSGKQKQLLKDDPEALYTVLPNDTAKQIAFEVIEEMGVENAVAEASRKNSGLEPVERVMILGAAMDYYAGLSKAAAKKGLKKDVARNADLELDANEKMQEVARVLGGLGTTYGRAINIFNEVYKLSNLALERKLIKTVDQINKLRNPTADESATVVEGIIKDEKNVIRGIGQQMTDDDAAAGQDLKKRVSDLEKEVADLRAQIKNVQNAKTGTKANPLKINRVTNATEYDKRLKEFQQRQRTGISKDDLNDLTYFGLYHIENGLTKFADWYSEMARKFKNFTQYLRDIYFSAKDEVIDKGADVSLFDSEDVVDNHLQKLKLDSDARKVVAASKRLADAKVREAKENDPDKARIVAPRFAAERIRRDAAVNLDLTTTKKEQTYLKKLIQVVQNKAREYYKEKNEKIPNVNDWLQFAIANGKADYAIWERTQEEVESQIDVDENLTEDEKEQVKEFLSDYQESIFDTLLTKGQKEEIIRQKLIEKGFSTEKTINGKVVKAVDWDKVIGSAKNIKEARAAIVKSITDLGYTEAEAAGEINSILNDFDNKVADKKTKAINSYLNKGAINKVKSVLGVTRKGKVQKLIDMNNKGILDDSRVKDVLAKDLGIISLTEEDLQKLRDLSQKIDNATVPFIKKKYEEQLQYLFDSKSGNLTYLENREFVMNNRLTSLWNNIQNMTGYFRTLSTYITIALKTGSPVQAAKIFKKEWKSGVSDALTVLVGGHVSRGTAFSDLTRSTEGEPRVRYLEQGKGRLLGLPDLYVKAGRKVIQVNPINALYRKIKYVARILEAADTIPSNVISGLTQYWQVRKQLQLLNPELSSKQLEEKTYSTMYGVEVEAAKKQAYLALVESGVPSPTKFEVNRATHEIVERKRNEILSKQFYETIDSLKPAAEQRLKDKGNDNPTGEEITKEAYLILGRDEPLDIVARGERQALRETGKKTTAGISALVLMPIDKLQKGLKKEMLAKHGQAGKWAVNVSDAAFNQLLPFANSIGRWIEMGLELTPYGVLKGLGYKGYGQFTKKSGNKKLSPVELNELGDDYIIRGIQGTAQTLAAMYLIGLLKGSGDDDDDDKVTGLYRGTDFPKDRISQIGNPQRSLDIAGRKFPLDLIGNAAYPIMMYSDFLDRRTAENERHGILYTTAAMYLSTAAQSSFTRLDQYGTIVKAIQAGKEEKFLPPFGRLAGNYLGAQFIPFNRLQQEVGELWNPKSTTSITFGENLLQQFSIMGGLIKDHPAFDYRGREYDKGDIWVGSPDGIRKMFTKSKTADEIDSHLAQIDFGATDAYRETKDEENYKYTIENADGTRRFMTNEEYYNFKKLTGVEFNTKLAQNFEIIKSLSILNVEGNVDEKETEDAQRDTYSALLTKAKENALALIQAKTGHMADIEERKEERKEKNEEILKQKKEQLEFLINE